MPKDLSKEVFPVYEIISGSRAYGTFHENSDFDYRSVFSCDPKDILDPFYGEETVDTMDGKEDRVEFELRKFLRLASGCNPNVLEYLFVPESCIKFVNFAFKECILDNRKKFLTMEAEKRFTGYMTGQISRMKLHQDWFKNPPDAPPDRSDFGVPECLTNDQISQIVAMPSEIQEAVAAKFKSDVSKWQDFLSERRKWKNYQRWLKERNPERAELEKKYGYDTKHFSHVLRLGFEAIDIASLETIQMPHPDVQILKDARAGKFSADEASQMAEDAISKARDAFAKNSTLPKDVDKEFLHRVYIKVMKYLFS